MWLPENVIEAEMFHLGEMIDFGNLAPKKYTMWSIKTVKKYVVNWEFLTFPMHTLFVIHIVISWTRR